MNNIVKLKLPEIKILMNQHGVIRAHLFGRAAEETFNECRDVDFLVSFNPTLTNIEYCNNYSELVYSLQTLLKKNVDLVVKETLINPFLIRRIEAQKVSVL